MRRFFLFLRLLIYIHIHIYRMYCHKKSIQKRLVDYISFIVYRGHRRVSACLAAIQRWRVTGGELALLVLNS